MNINLEYYKVFYYVAKNESITKASIELMTSQPNVSKVIKILEEQTSVTLFNRSNTGVTLTDDGKDLYNKIKPAIETLLSVDNDINNIGKKDCGLITIGVNSIILHEHLIPILKGFHKLYPKINYKFYSEGSSEIIDALDNRIIDLAFIMMPINVSPELNVTKLKDTHNCLAASKEYLYLKDTVLGLDDIASLPLAILNRNSTTRTLFDKYCYKNGVSIKPVAEFDNSYHIKDYVLAGLGIGLLNEDVIAKELDNDTLIKLKTSIPIDDIYLAMLNNSNNNKYITNLFMDYIKKDFK